MGTVEWRLKKPPCHMCHPLRNYCEVQTVLGLGSRWQLFLRLAVDNDWLEFTFFSKQNFEQNVVISNALLNPAYKKKCISALNFRKCLFFYGIIFELLFQQKEKFLMGKIVGIRMEREEGNIILNYIF